MKRSLLATPLLLALACGGAEPPETATPTTVTTPEPEPGDEAGEPLVPDSQTATGDNMNSAPEFTLPDVEGNEVSLASHRGKTVVLEWFNPGCPFVKYAHGEGPLKTMASEVADDVVWLAINSGAEGKQGADPAMNKTAMADWKMAYPLLLDRDGKVGQAYGAKTTPHMYIIDPEGNVVYRGALDNAPMGKVEEGGEYKNYVTAALEDLSAGREVAVAETKSYGCSVKY